MWENSVCDVLILGSNFVAGLLCTLKLLKNLQNLKPKNFFQSTKNWIDPIQYFPAEEFSTDPVLMAVAVVYTGQMTFLSPS